MALPQKAIEQLSREPVRTPGWSFSIMMMAGTVFFLSAAVMLGMSIGYKPFYEGQLASVELQKKRFQAEIDAASLESLISFYSQLGHVGAILRRQPDLSKAFEWFESNTQENVYFTNFSLDVGKSALSLQGEAKTITDLAEQIKIFEDMQRTRNKSGDLLKFGFQGSGEKAAKTSSTVSSWPLSVNMVFAPEFLVPRQKAATTSPATSSKK